MNDERRQLLEELKELLDGLDWRFSGRPEAALGSYGKRIVRSMVDAGLFEGDDQSQELGQLLEAGCDSLLSDYRISEVDLNSMRCACKTLRERIEKNSAPDQKLGPEGVRRP